MNGLSQWMQSPEVIRKKSCSWCWTNFKFPHIDPSAGHLRAYLTFIIRLLFSILLLRTYCTDTSRTSEDTSIIIVSDTSSIVRSITYGIDSGAEMRKNTRNFRHNDLRYESHLSVKTMSPRKYRLLSDGCSARNFWNVTGCVPPNQLVRIFPAVETHRYCTND